MTGLLSLNDTKAIKFVERRQQALKLVDSVLKYRGKERWLETRRLWLMLAPDAEAQHREALAEARFVRETLYDPVFGRSKAAMGLDPTARVNKNTTLRVVTVMPEGLHLWLKRFDPFNLTVPRGHTLKDNWRLVYQTFPEYVVVEKI